VRIAVMAAGAVGGYFGGRMAAAGHDVAFIARGAQGDAIRRNGLRIESALYHLQTGLNRNRASAFACKEGLATAP
jgi:2-dehydropantoate 2-reductase